MLSGEGNAGERWKTTIGLISKKATLHVQHTFLYISLPLFCTTRALLKWKSKPPSHWNQRWSCTKTKASQFSLIWSGKGQGGGRGSQFSKYMYFVQSTILDWIQWSRKPPSLPWMKPHKSPSVPFSPRYILWKGNRVWTFRPFCLRLWDIILISAKKRHDCIIDLPKWSKWGTEIIWIKKISFKYLTSSAIVHVDFLKWEATLGKGSSRFSSCNKVIIKILVTKVENLSHIPQLFVVKIKYITCN